jgi:hypothetical protein
LKIKNAIQNATTLFLPLKHPETVILDGFYVFRKTPPHYFYPETVRLDGFYVFRKTPPHHLPLNTLKL